MSDSFPVPHMNADQFSLLIAQRLVYQQYLQRNVAPSVKRDGTFHVLQLLLLRFDALFAQHGGQMVLLLTVEEMEIIKEGLLVLQNALEAKRPSAQRAQAIQHLVTMQTLIEQTFPTSQDTL